MLSGSLPRPAPAPRPALPAPEEAVPAEGVQER